MLPLPLVLPCLSHPSLSSPESDQNQHKAERSIPTLGCFDEDGPAHGTEGWCLAPAGLRWESRLDLRSRSELELNHWG